MVVMEKGNKVYTLDEIIDMYGVGWFSVKLILILGSVWVMDAVEITLVTLISPFMKCYWNMNNAKTALLTSTVFVGMGIGSLIWGKFADIYGRRKVLICAIFFLTYFSFLSTFTKTYVWFFLIRLFVGCGTGCIIIAPCYISEYVATKLRGAFIAILQLFFVLGNIYVSLLGYYTLPNFHWQLFLLLSVIPCLISYVIVVTWLPKSLRFLQESGDFVSIHQSFLHLFGKDPNKPLPRKILISTDRVTVNRGKLNVLFHKEHRTQSLAILMLWLSSFICYFTSIFLFAKISQIDETRQSNTTCQYLPPKAYLQNIPVIFGEVPALLIGYFTMERIGRKMIIRCSAVISALCFIMFTLNLSRFVKIFLILVIRSCGALIAQTSYTVAAENYPTRVRVTATSFFNTLARFSVIFVPFIVDILLHTSLFGFSMLFCMLYVVSFVSTFFFEETTGKQLPH